MSKRRTSQRSPPPNAAISAAPSRTRRWALRLGLLIFAPALFVLIVELVLRLSGIGYPTSFLVRSEEGHFWVPNFRFGWQFFAPELSIYPYPFRVPIEKPPGTLRIFVLGESAAQGTPDPSFGFARVLEVMLGQQFPERKVEIYNAAMRGIDSHVIRLIARDCVRAKPDLFLLYLGNNEAIGLHSPDPDSSHFQIPLTLVRFSQTLKSSRLGQLLKLAIRTVRKTDGKTTQDMAYFRKNRLPADDSRRQATYAWFQANLKSICEAARHARAKIMMSTVPVNLQDFPPLASLHRAGLTEADQKQWDGLYQEGMAAEAAGQYDRALGKYLEAARLDDHFAELRFRLARCYLAKSQFQEAGEHFQGACDWDALHFRADRRLNDILRKQSSANTNQGVIFINAEKEFALQSLREQSFPGVRLFNDHVHLNFEGDYLLARTFLPGIGAALGLANTNGLEFPTRQQCADFLAFTAWDELNVSAAMIKALDKPPFLDQLEHDLRQARAHQALQQALNQFTPEQVQQAIAAYRRTLARQPNDWQLHHNFANFYLDMKQTSPALEELRIALQLFPQAPPLRLELAQLLGSAGQTAEARRLLEELLRHCPDFPPARQALGQMKPNER